MAIITSTIKEHKYIEMLVYFLIPSNENCFGDDKVIFPNDDSSCHREKGN